VSRFFDAVRRADESRQRPREILRPFALQDLPREQRPFRALAVVSNKGGVGKTTVATNLAVYLRAMREDVPILLVGLDDQPTIDRMFAIEPGETRPTILDALRSGSLTAAIRLGNYGVNYLPTSPRIGELKREISDPGHLHAALLRTGWRGIVIIDTKSDLEILTQSALAASDLALVLARDLPSLSEAQKVFDLLAAWKRPPESARVLLSLVDLRVRYSEGQDRDVLSLLLAEIRRMRLPLLESFLSSSPKVDSLATNPSRAARTILHGAPGSVVHRQMQHLADEVLRILHPHVAQPETTQAAAAPAAAMDAPEPPAPRAEPPRIESVAAE
jgi:cellulose biosynthesis protein BcsQ